MDTIYLLRDSQGYFKIGFTKYSAKTRIPHLHTGCADDLQIIYEFKTRHKRKLETALHNLYESKHHNREFYELDIIDELEFPTVCQKIETALDAIKNNVYYESHN